LLTAGVAPLSGDGDTAEVTDIEQLLRGLAGDPVFFVPNPGNAGDALIAAAAFQLFRRVGLHVHLVTAGEAFDSTGKVVIYGGGGNLLPLYTNAREFIGRHHRSARRLIVLPQTIAGNEDLLGSLGPNVTVVCRELISLRHVSRHAPRAKVLIAHDLALNLDVEAMLAQPGLVANAGAKLRLYLLGRREDSKYFVSPKYFVRDWWFLGKMDLQRLRRPHAPLPAFRTDVERCGVTPPNNLDLSRHFMYGSQSERIVCYVGARLLSAINRFSEIHTNRLHVCIAAALLGKTVKFYPNSYYNCQAVYEFSLADRFRNVTWMGTQ
jgi:exopolysaccharide biosynthesis predicted pyruvyltransferase EpsI